MSFVRTSWWLILLGVGVGVQHINGVWVGMVLMPMSLDPDLFRAYELLRESGAHDPFGGSLIVAGIGFLLTLATVVCGVRLVERRFPNAGADAVMARCAMVFFAIGFSGAMGALPGHFMSFPLADLVEHATTYDILYSTWLSVFLPVQFGAFALAVFFGLAAELTRARKRNSRVEQPG